MFPLSALIPRRFPTFSEFGEIHVQVMGAVQLEILKSLISERFGENVEFGPGSMGLSCCQCDFHIRKLRSHQHPRMLPLCQMGKDRIQEMVILTGKAPVSAMGDYQKQVYAYTKGAGRLFCAPGGYGSTRPTP